MQQLLLLCPWDRGSQARPRAGAARGGGQQEASREEGPNKMEVGGEPLVVRRSGGLPGRPPPQAQLCWSRPVPLPSGSAAPRWPALPRAAGRVPCGRLPSLAHEGPSAQVLSCWALVGGLGGPHPSASGTSTVFGLLWGAPTPQLCSPVGGPHSLPAQLRGAASVRGPGLSAHQGARHLHTGAALTLGLGVAPE